MKLTLLLSTLASIMLGAFNTNAQSTFYAVSPFGSSFEIMDSTSMTSTSSIPLTSNFGTVNGANGLAVDECGTMYIVYQTSGVRRLGTINPATAAITDIGSLGDNVANIAFANGSLFAVTGDGAATPEAFYEVNTTTAAMTFIMTLGNGNDGESIEFNPDDGLIYHWSGWGSANVIMETIDIATFTVGPSIPLTGASLANVGSSTYVGNGRFLISDVNTTGLKYITTSGVVTATSNTNGVFKGLAFPIETVVTNTTSPNDSICAGDTAVLVCNNTGGTYEWFQDGTSTGNTTNTLDATVTGAYVCEFDNGFGCPLASDTIFLTVSNIPTANITPSPTASICDGDSLELTVNAGGGPALFQWYVDGAAIPGATTSSYFTSDAGSYNVLKTNQNGCSDSSTVATVVTVNNTPTSVITPSPTATFCAGDSVELTVNAGGGQGTIQWSLNGVDIIGATGSSYFATASGTYNVIKTNANGCSDEADVPTVVTSNPLPSVALTPSGTVNFCAGDTVEISITQGAGGGNFQWFLNGSAISGATNPTIFATAEGAYNLQKTNMNGCSDTSAVATVLVDTCSNNLFEMKGLNIEVYPNPANDFVKIDLSSISNSGVVNLELLGLDGKLLRVFTTEKPSSNIVTLDISHLNAGVYFIRMTTVYGQLVKELIIE